MELRSSSHELCSLYDGEGRRGEKKLFKAAISSVLSFTAAACKIKFKRSVNNSAVIEQFKQKLLLNICCLGGGQKQGSIVQCVTTVAPFLKNHV